MVSATASATTTVPGDLGDVKMNYAAAAAAAATAPLINFKLTPADKIALSTIAELIEKGKIKEARTETLTHLADPLKEHVLQILATTELFQVKALRIRILTIDTHPAFPKIFQFVFDGNDEAAFAEAQQLPEPLKKSVIAILFLPRSYIEKVAAIYFVTAKSYILGILRSCDIEHLSLFVESVLARTKAKVPVTFREVMNGKAVSQWTRSNGKVLTVLNNARIAFQLTGEAGDRETDKFTFGSITGLLDSEVSAIAFTQHCNCEVSVMNAEAESDTKQQHAAEAEAKTSASVIRKFATEAFLHNRYYHGDHFFCLSDVQQTKSIDGEAPLLKFTHPIKDFGWIRCREGDQSSYRVYNPNVDRNFFGYTYGRLNSSFYTRVCGPFEVDVGGQFSERDRFYENGSDNILVLCSIGNRFPEKWVTVRNKMVGGHFDKFPECSSGYFCFTYMDGTWKPIQLFDFFKEGENIGIPSSLPSDSHVEQIRRQHPFVVSGNYAFRFFPDRLEVIDFIAKKVIRSLPCVLSSDKREFAKTTLGPRSMGELLHRIYTGETRVEDPEDYDKGCPHHYELDRERVVQITQDTRVRARVISTSGEIYLGEVEKDRSPDAFFAHGIECIKGLMEVRPHVYLRRDRMSYEDESGRSTICGRFTAEPRLPISDWTFMEAMSKLTPQEFSLWTVPQLVRKVSAYLTHDWGDEKGVWTTKTPIFFRPQKDRIATRESEVKTRAAKSEGGSVGSAAAAAAAAPSKPQVKGLDEPD